MFTHQFWIVKHKHFELLRVEPQHRLYFLYSIITVVNWVWRKFKEKGKVCKNRGKQSIAQQMRLAANCTRDLVVEQYQQRIPTTLLVTPRHELILLSQLSWLKRLGLLYLCRLETAPQIMYTGRIISRANHWPGLANKVSKMPKLSLRIAQRFGSKKASNIKPCCIHKWNSRGPWFLVQPAVGAHTHFSRVIDSTCCASSKHHVRSD